MRIIWLIAVEGNKTYVQLYNGYASSSWSDCVDLYCLTLDSDNSELIIPGRSARTEIDLLVSLGYTDEQLWEYYSEYRDRVVGNTRSR